MKEKILCGVDIGGTKLAAGLFTRDGAQIDRVEIHDHVELDHEAFCARIAGLVRELLATSGIGEESLLGIGIGFAGHIRFREGLIITTSNFKRPFRNFPLRANIQESFGVPVVLDNDANAQAWGEYLFGAGRGREDVVFLTVSSGIGAGIIVSGRMVRGATGTAGEVGHAIVKFDSEMRCTCGNPGCLMALSSGIFFPQLFATKLREGRKTEMGIDASNVDSVDGRLVAEGLRRGDPICTEIAMDSADIVGLGIYNIFSILNPETVILGGGLMNLGDIYLERIKSSFLSYVQDMMYDPLEIVNAELGSDSGLIGAAALPLEQGYE